MRKLPLIGITTYHRDARGYIQLPGAYADVIDHCQRPDQPYGSIPHEVSVKEASGLAQIMGSESVVPAS